MKKHLSFILLLAGFALARCATDMGPVDTTVTVQVAVEAGVNQRDTTYYTSNWDAFYFYADTAFYAAPTWEDVKSKQLRTRDFEGNTAVTKSAPDGTAEVLDTTRVRFSHLRAKAVLVIHQPEIKSYAWRQVDLVDGLPNLWLSTPIKIWGTRTSYTENKWTVVVDRTVESESESGPVS